MTKQKNSADSADSAENRGVDGRTLRTSQTFDDLVDYLERYGPGDDGQWPEVNIWNYDRGSSADGMAWRIRKGKVRLPDEHGGKNGRWNARVQRVKKGRENVDGPCRIWVQYLGMKEGK